MNLAKLMNQAQQLRAELAAKQEEPAKQTVVDPSGDLLSRISPNEDILAYKRHQIETKSYPQREFWLFRSLPATTSTDFWRRSITGFLDQEGVNVLRKFYPPEDVELLALFGWWLNALHDGYEKSADERMVIKPQNNIEEHFALVSHGRETPIYHFERVWLSFHADQEFLMLVKHEKYGDCSWRDVLVGFLQLADRGNQKAKKWIEGHGGRDEVLTQIGSASPNEGPWGVYFNTTQVRG